MKPIQFLKVNAWAIAAVIVAGTTMSFKMAEKQAKADDQVFYYNSTDTSPNAFANPANWSETPTFSCSTTGNKPCKMVVPAGEELIDQIGGLSNAQVLNIHPTERKP